MRNYDQMHAYYSARAPLMAQRLATQPSPQVLEIIGQLRSMAQDQTVLEIACGPGYWTRFVAPVARETVATDYSVKMLNFARAQFLPNTRYIHDDAYRLRNVGGVKFDFGFAMHWVSHIPLTRWSQFFTAFHSHMKHGAIVLLADDIHRPNDNDPYYSKLDTHDSYERRQLPDGSAYEIVKTYFTPDQLRELLQPYGKNLKIHFERPRWWLTYEVKR